MKTQKLLLFVFALMFCILLQNNVYAAEQTYTKTIRVQLKDGVRDVNTVWIDMKNPNIRVEAVLAKGSVGEVDTFQNIYNSAKDENTEIIAAINGTFFNVHSDLQPIGNIQVQGRNVFISNSGSSIGFTADNKIKTDWLYTTISGSINGNWEYPYNWSVWGINQVFYTDNANILYTPDFGNEVDAGNKTAIVIRNNKVVEIKKGLAPIHSDGYTLVFGAEVYSALFKIGDGVDYKVNYNQTDFSQGMKKGNTIDWSDVRTTIGAGPMLVKKGEALDNAAKEGFTDVKFTGRAQRSFIGEDKNSFLVMGTVNNVTLVELATILKDIGLINAINLDGGASSALMFEGKIITTPTRELSNSIVITAKKDTPIRLQLNGKEMFFDTDPYFSNSRTMVPLRGVMESVGADVGWDSATGAIFASKGDTKVEMWNDSDIVLVNGIEHQLDVSVQVRYNRTHVPVRFMTEIFGAEVDFLRDSNMVTIKMENTNPTEVYDKAISEYDKGNTLEAENLFLKVLEIEPSHAGAMLKLAKHYSSTDKAKSAIYYEQFLTLQPKDYSVWNSLGWTYAELGDIPKALGIFKDLTNQMPDTAEYWIALGDMYSHYQMQDYEAAKDCYNKALTCNPSESQKARIQRKLGN
ncbi:MAG: tetratricopeptide repeat protein [Clostridiaceae bacterium]|jgi:tetratricopeptide (TPR) repeat protein|nr:tetratricopeptide repeat protein [Clostridiaceae bacterium]